jgi:ribosomal protein S12
MVRNLIKLLDQYDLRKKIIAYVKGEGANLNAMIIVLIHGEL